MHIAITLRKFVLAWFGVSCWNEIDLYDRGLKLYNEDLFCSPCWKKQCPYDLECIKLIDLDGIVSAIDVFFRKKNSNRVPNVKK
jgi:heptosyltransferase-2